MSSYSRGTDNDRSARRIIYRDGQPFLIAYNDAVDVGAIDYAARLMNRPEGPSRDEIQMQLKAKIQAQALTISMLEQRIQQPSVTDKLEKLVLLMHRKKEIPIATPFRGNDGLLYRRMAGIKRAAIELCEAMWGIEVAVESDVMVQYNKDIFLKKMILLILEVYGTAVSFGVPLDEAVKISLMAELGDCEANLEGMI